MQIKAKYSWLKHLDFMLVDLTALILAFLLSYTLKFGAVNFLESEEWNRYLLIILILSVIINFFINPYSGILRRSYYMEVIRAFQLTIYNLLITSLLFYAFKIGEDYSREMSFYMYGFYFILSLSMKFIWKKLLISGKVVVNTTRRIPLFIVGTSEGMERIIRNVTAGDFQLYDVRGVFFTDRDQDQRNELIIEGLPPVPVITSGFEEYILNQNISEVLIAVSPERVDKKILERLNENGVGINLIVESAMGFQPEDQYILNFGVYKTLSIGAFTFTPGQMLYLGIKRFIDILAGLIGMVLLIPITLLVKISYLLSGDSSRIFYRQVRIGKDGRKIKIWKYRSMVSNADEVLQELLQNPEYKLQWEENQKLENDPRITKVGKILRKTSIDELPQMMNVLTGDMSIVGPRPLIEGELEQHGGLKLYQRVKPGITGWWGCNGRSNIDYRERLELEYYYVKHCSLHLDLLCILRTILAVLKRDGAQ